MCRLKCLLKLVILEASVTQISLLVVYVSCSKVRSRVWNINICEKQCTTPTFSRWSPLSFWAVVWLITSTTSFTECITSSSWAHRRLLFQDSQQKAETCALWKRQKFTHTWVRCRIEHSSLRFSSCLMIVQKKEQNLGPWQCVRRGPRWCSCVFNWWPTIWSPPKYHLLDDNSRAGARGEVASAMMARGAMSATRTNTRTHVVRVGQIGMTHARRRRVSSLSSSPPPSGCSPENESRSRFCCFCMTFLWHNHVTCDQFLGDQLIKL